MAWGENTSPVFYGILEEPENEVKLTKEKGRKLTPTLGTQNLNRKGWLTAGLWEERVVFHQDIWQEVREGAYVTLLDGINVKGDVFVISHVEKLDILFYFILNITEKNYWGHLEIKSFQQTAMADRLKHIFTNLFSFYF